MNKTLTKATIHLNGTSGRHLLDEAIEEYDAVDQAMSLMARHAPHARDYYVQGENAYANACKEHNDRIARLRSVLDEMRELIENLQAQLYAKQK